MCFSAEASFGLSAALIPAGAYCVKKALEKDRKMLPAAVIPLVFGIQQFSEGWVWIGLGRDDAAIVKNAALFFLSIAVCFWPFWVPLCSFVTGSNRTSKAFFGALSLIGLVGGLAAFVPLLFNADSPIATQQAHSIHYHIADSAVFRYVPMSLWEVIYVVIVSSPLFASASMRILFLGVALVLSAAMSYFLFQYTFASVWCFFAAMLSLYLCVFFRNLPSATAAPGAGQSR